MASSPCTLVLSDLALELGVEEGLDGGAGKLQDELDEDDERHQLEPPGGVNEAGAQVVPHMAGHEMQGEDDGEHHTPDCASLDKDRQVGPLKVGKDATDNLAGSME